MKGQVYGYDRISSKDQNSIRRIEALRKSGVKEKNIFIDYASGKDFNRTGYQELMRKARIGDVLIIKSIDRIGRNYNEIIGEWKNITKACKY